MSISCCSSTNCRENVHTWRRAQCRGQHGMVHMQKGTVQRAAWQNAHAGGHREGLLDSIDGLAFQQTSGCKQDKLLSWQLTASTKPWPESEVLDLACSALVRNAWPSVDALSQHRISQHMALVDTMSSEKCSALDAGKPLAIQRLELEKVALWDGPSLMGTVNLGGLRKGARKLLA
eukprot:51493-Pelagomonas_calceolata.AAC.3